MIALLVVMEVVVSPAGQYDNGRLIQTKSGISAGDMILSFTSQALVRRPDVFSTLSVAPFTAEGSGVRAGTRTCWVTCSGSTMTGSRMHAAPMCRDCHSGVR